MHQINLAENKDKNLEYWTQKILITVGERLAIILFGLSIPAFFIVLGTTQALSKEEDKFAKQEFNFYEESSNFAKTNENLEISYSFTSETITPSPTPVIKVQGPLISSDDIWEKLADCESHKNWSSNTGNGYYGGLQFSQGAWNSVGGNGLPSDAGKDEQIMRGKILQERRGWGPWGACSKKLGLL